MQTGNDISEPVIEYEKSVTSNRTRVVPALLSYRQNFCFGVAILLESLDFRPLVGDG